MQAMSEHSRMVRLPLNKIGEISKINKVYSALEQTFQRPPSAVEIARELDMSPAQVKLAIKNSGKHLSMDAPFEEGESSNLYNVIKSQESNSPDTKMMKDSLRMDIEMVLKTLPSREREIIRLNYGIGERNPMSLSQIGELFDITRERVRQIRAKALRILQNKSRNQILKAYL